MRITDHFAELLERELVISRRVLEHVPEGRADWKPHEKSMAHGYLATLVATMPSWIAMTIEQDELDLAPPGGGGYGAPRWQTRAELLALLDQSGARARGALAGTTEAFLQTPWRLLVGGRVVSENPRQTVIADTICHAAHHRGQLSVYLRLLGATVPAMYGPSADERVF